MKVCDGCFKDFFFLNSYDIKILQDGKIGVFEGIESTASKECIICHYQYLSDKGFKFQLDVCKGSHYIINNYIKQVLIILVLVIELAKAKP